MTATPKKPKICVLFCGGTIMMSKDAATGSLDIAGGTQELLSLEPKLREFYDIDIKFIDNIDSTNTKEYHWDKMIHTIAENYKGYDGFVITHGTNTLGYTSSALSFALQGIGKPVVLTGAQIPANQLETDARRNFVNAVKVAAMNLAGVFVVFGSKIMLGTRAKKISEYDLDAFKTFNAQDVGEIGISIQLKGEHKKRHHNPFTPHPGFNPNILVITLEPGIRTEDMMVLLSTGVKGFVLRAYGAGDIPYTLLPWLEKARDLHVPIVVTTQCPGGVTRMGMNDVGLQARKSGVIQAFDMSMESMTTKLKWLLHQKTPDEQLKAKMEENLCGEIVPIAEYT